MAIITRNHKAQAARKLIVQAQNSKKAQNRDKSKAEPEDKSLTDLWVEYPVIGAGDLTGGMATLEVFLPAISDELDTALAVVAHEYPAHEPHQSGHFLKKTQPGSAGLKTVIASSRAAFGQGSAAAKAPWSWWRPGVSSEAWRRDAQP